MNRGIGAPPVKHGYPARRLALLAVLFLLTGCGGDPRPELWVYTSIYQEVLDQLKPLSQGKLPGVVFRWYKAGSEEVAARVTAELASGACQADVLLTADVFWTWNLAREENLMRLPADILEKVPPPMRDVEGRYLNCRVSAMILAVNGETIPEASRPKSFLELLEPQWKGKVVMGDPLKSGTSFTTVALLARKYGWDYLSKLRRNDILIEGGNSAVLRRVELGDRPVGVILMENVLKARKQKSPAVLVLPSDGAVVIPSPIAVTSATDRAGEALDFCRFILSPEGQDAMVAGYMYPVVAGRAGPEGAPPLEALMANAIMADELAVKEIATGAEEIKERFVQVMYE